MPVLFSSYVLTKERINVRKGLLSVREEEILLYRVLDISFRQGILERLLGLGTLMLYSTDTTAPVLSLQSIKNPRQVRNLLRELVEENRQESGVRGREMFGATVAELTGMQ